MSLQIKAEPSLHPTPENPLRIGTRGSPLALAQARQTRDRLMAAHGLSEDCFSIQAISTAGDRILGRPLSQLGGKGLFTQEIEDKLLSGDLDLAVHSTKDMPTILPDGLEMTTFLLREDPRDAFLSHSAKSLEDLPAGAVVGTASLRRQALVRRLRPDLKVVNYRGNVQTRLEKLKNGVVDATLLAAAGLNRLDLSHHITTTLPRDSFVPAIGQGAVGLEVRSSAHDVKTMLSAIHDHTTALCVIAERAFLRELDGSCRTPIAGHARIESETMLFHGLVISIDGQEAHEVSHVLESPDENSAARLGMMAGKTIRQNAGEEFLAAILQHETVLETR
ncbi:MAG: hydroxymethylbilane synthase [Rhizobiales bacterium]|nr:hydroxymethylbilane synthase [Hyphomicrobiales bacterium]